MSAPSVGGMSTEHQVDGLLSRMSEMANSPRLLGRLLTLAGSAVQPSGWAILTILHRHGQLRVSELADQLGLDQSTVSRQLKPLDAAGLITRQAHDGDRRVAILSLSDKGTEAYDAVRQRWLDDLNWFMRNWSDADRAHFGELAERFADEIDAGRAGLRRHDETRDGAA
jgi:DNA-binding MarR family transcriptional regulator